MSCAYRIHRYRASVTARPTSVSWQHPTEHTHHPTPLRPLVVYPHRQAVMETGTSTDDASIPVSLVQYLWSRWQESPPDVRDAVTAVIGELMRLPRWHWDVTVLRDQSPPDPQHPFVSERDNGRPTIGMPIAMLRELWVWVLHDTRQRSSIMQWIASGIDSSLWQELCTYQLARVPRLTKRKRYPLYGYLPPLRLPDIVRETHHLLSSADPDDQQMALTVLERWMASPDSATRTLVAQMLRAWLNEQAAASPTHDQLRLQAFTMLSSSDDPAVVSTRLYDLLRTERNWIKRDDVRTVIGLLHRLGAGRSLAMDRWMSLMEAMVRDHPSEVVIHEVLDRLPTIVPPDRPDVRVRWAATLWTLITDSTLSDARRQTIATALTPMMQEPMVAALVHAQLCTEPSLLQTLPASICDTLLAGLIQTAHADAVLTMIAQAIRQNPTTIARFDPIVAAGWGHGQDHRILQMVTSFPSPHWQMVLTQGITTSVGAAVCDRIGSWFSRDQAIAMITNHIRAREERGDWPLDPLPAYLIPWVGAAARRRPDSLHPTTIRRLWRADPNQAWDVTQTMLDSGHRFVQQRAIAAMDAGWGTGMDDAIATTLRTLTHQDLVLTGTTTAVAGIGIAPPSIMESLLTELATSGNTDVQRWLIQGMHRGWGRGQDALMMRILETMGERDPSGWIWAGSHETLIRAWDYHPPHVVVSLVDRVVTHAMNRLAKDELYCPLGPWEVQQLIAAFAPIWTHLPTPQVIERIAHHVAHLHAHAHSIDPSRRDPLVAAWAQVIAAGAERLSASDIHAVLAPLWDLSPHGCLTGMTQWVHR